MATEIAPYSHMTDLPENGTLFTVNVSFNKILLFDLTSNYNVTDEC
jgi:hypothetical protein